MGSGNAKSKYMIMSLHQTTGLNHYIRISNKFFENVAKFRHLGVMVTSKFHSQRN
jgi:hypothetical protein